MKIIKFKTLLKTYIDSIFMIDHPYINLYIRASNRITCLLVRVTRKQIANRSQSKVKVGKCIERFHKRFRMYATVASKLCKWCKLYKYT